MAKNKTHKHTTSWEDQQTAMLESCNGKPLPPGNAPILSAAEPIKCPICGEFIVLRWNVYVDEIGEQEVRKFMQRRGY